MSIGLFFYSAILCAVILPYFWSKASDPKCTKKDLFLLGSCLVNGLLVFAVILVITAK